MRTSHLVVLSRSGCLRLLFSHFLSAVLSLYLGIIYGFLRHESLCPVRDPTSAMVLHAAASPTHPRLLASTTNGLDDAQQTKTTEAHVPASVSKLLVGASTVDLNDFVMALPLGTPMNGNKGIVSPRSKHVLLLHLTSAALPHQSELKSNGTAVRELPMKGATRNCRQIRHLVTSTVAFMRTDRSCTVLVRKAKSSDSFHVQKWKRPNSQLPTRSRVTTTRSTALVMAGRYEYIDDRSFNAGMRIVPRPTTQALSRMELQSYLGAFDSALEALRPIAAPVAGAGTKAVQGTVIVLVTNFGHSILLRNYVCAARAVGMDTDKILVVATDRPTLDVGRSLGVATFYHEQLFAGIPESASSVYGDSQYSRIMMSKAYCVHLVSQLGYNILFQDVDIVPYQPNVLEWWIDVAASGYDLYFQFDFSTRPNYAPWVANSGSYFATSNARTKFFFSKMIWTFDVILDNGSHQSSMHYVLSELSSLYGLRIKTLQQNQTQIPIGFHFHRNHDFMKEMIRENKTKTVAFHMNWNENAEKKILFLEQMGDWHIPEDVNSTTCQNPVVAKCHFRDVPSIIPCRTSPALDSGRRSFW